MRIFCLANNWVGWQVLKHLVEQGEDIVGVVIHPLKKQKYVDDILKTVNLPDNKIFDGSRINEPKTVESIRRLNPDIGLSILFDYILRKDVLTVFPLGVLNLHPALLPYNRGQYPNVWSIVEQTPSGVTLHYLDEGVDTGDIVAQKEIPVEPIDTGETLYRKLEQTSVSLFRKVWPIVRSGKVRRIKQENGQGTYHRVRDVDAIDEITLDRSYLAGDLINILRARTFPPHEGAYFTVNGRKVYMRIQLDYEKDI